MVRKMIYYKNRERIKIKINIITKYSVMLIVKTSIQLERIVNTQEVLANVFQYKQYLDKEEMQRIIIKSKNIRYILNVEKINS